MVPAWLLSVAGVAIGAYSSASLLGGQGLVLGPLVGADTYQGLRGYLLTSPLFKSLHLAMAGLFLLLIVLFVPAGAVGWLRHRFRRLRPVLE